MSLLRPKTSNTQIPTKLLGYQAQTSIYGKPIPIVYGQNRISGNVIWYGDWKANPVKQTGGKGGGGKGNSGGKGGTSGQQYTYQSAISIGLCAGPIAGLGYIWVDKIKLTLNNSSESYTIPGGGGSYTPVHAPNFVGDLGSGARRSYSVTANDYGSPGAVTLSGNQTVPLKRVSSGPVANQYSVDPITGIYTFGAAMGGQTVVIGYTWSDPNSSNDGDPVGTLSFTFFNGAQGQSPWSYLTTNHPDQAIGYSTLAHVDNELLDLKSSGIVSNYGFEVFGLLPVGGGITDCNIADIVNHFLTDPIQGCLFPISAIGDLGEMRAYSAANSLFISPSVDSQRTAASWLQEWLTICNCEAVWSEGRLKFRSYGDKTVVGNGVTFTPTTSPVYDLDEDDFLAKEGEDPIFVNRPSTKDAYNSVSVEWTNRKNAYSFEPIEEKDDNAINLYGYRPASPLQLHAIASQDVAQKVCNFILQRSLYVRNTYKFKLSAVKYALLEPMDMVTVSKLELGLNKTPVRIKTIQEDDKLTLSVECEEFPWGTATPTVSAKQTVGPFGPGYFSDPGFVNDPIFFEATAEMTQNILYELLIGLSGGPNWGGCNIHLSTDGGASYDFIGQQTGPSVMGKLTASYPSAADPDDTNTLSVDLTESLGNLDSFTAGQENAFVSLALVDNELIAYRTASLTSSYHYDLTHIRRGVFNTAPASHSSGTGTFAFIDAGLFSWIFDDTNVGQTVKFKFTSFNKAGTQEQDIANVTAYTYTVKGPKPGPITLIGSPVVDETDPGGIVVITQSYTGPNPLLHFAGIQETIQDVTGGHTDIPRPVGVQFFTGSGTQSYRIELQRPVGGDEQWKFWFSSYTDTLAPNPITSGTFEDPHVTVTVHQFIGSTLYPADPTIYTGSINVDNTDTQLVSITWTATPALPLNGLQGCRVWIQDITSGHTGTKPSQTSDAYFDLTALTPYTDSIHGGLIGISKPDTVELWRIWTVPFNGNGSKFDPLTSPRFDATISARGTSSGPPAVNVGTITATVAISSTAGDGGNHFGVWGKIAAPIGGWGSVDHVQVDLFGPTGTTSARLRTMFPLGKGSLPSGSADLNYNGLIGEPHLTEYDRPPAGTNETYYVQVTVFNSDGVATGAPTVSTSFVVTGGGSDTPAPDITAISNTVNKNGANYTVTSVFQLPVNYQYINSAYMHYRAYAVPFTGAVELDSMIGRLDYWNFSASDPNFNVSTRQFTFVHGGSPGYVTPDASQKYDVGMVVFSGANNPSLTPFFSAQFQVDPAATTGGTAGILPTTPTLTQDADKFSADGVWSLSLKLNWTNPTNTDAATILILIRDLAGVIGDRIVWVENIGQPGYADYGQATQQFVDYPGVTNTIQAIFYVYNAQNVQLSGTPAFAFLGPVAPAGKVDLTRTDASKRSNEFQVTGGVFNMKQLIVDKLIAGNLQVIMTITAGGRITVSGASGYTLVMDTATALLITNTTQNSVANLSDGMLKLSGIGVNAGYSATYGFLTTSISHVSGFNAQLTVGASASAVTLLGSSSVVMVDLSASTFGKLRLPTSGSFISVNGQYRINVSGVDKIFMDTSGNYRYNNYALGGGTMPATYVARYAALDGSGAFIGWINFT